MISLKQQIELSGVLEEACKTYILLLSAIRDHALRACPPLADSHAEALDCLCQSIHAAMPPESWELAGAAVHSELEAFGNRAHADFHAKEDEAREFARLVAAATGALVNRCGEGTTELTQTAARIEQIAALENPVELRRRLREGVQELKHRIELIRKRDAEVIEALRNEADTLRQRAVRAEQAACVDALTGLANRREFERQFRRRAETGEPFCVVVFDLNRFKAINDRHGHLAGDEVLKEFAHRLQNSLRTSDVPCRWGGDEFTVLLDCPLRDALMRSGQIADRVSGRYAVRFADQDLRLDVGAAAGVAEHRKADTIDQVLERADRALYAQKRSLNQLT